MSQKSKKTRKKYTRKKPLASNIIADLRTELELSETNRRQSVSALDEEVGSLMKELRSKSEHCDNLWNVIQAQREEILMLTERGLNLVEALTSLAEVSRTAKEMRISRMYSEPKPMAMEATNTQGCCGFKDPD